MDHSQQMRTGGQIVVDMLLARDVDTIFCVPGESFLPVLDALREVRATIRVIVCRHESAASHMAEAYGKLTGKPGICMVTRGPGATQASIGVHTASQDSTPMILLMGQVCTDVIGRDAWQEIDAHAVFGSLAKSVEQFADVQSIPQMLSRAFDKATSERPGPVVISMPEDVLYAQVGTAASALPARSVAAHATVDLAALRSRLEQAQRPIVIVGGGGWTEATCGQLRAFVEAFDLPVCASFRRQDIFDNTHPNYVGPLGIGVSDKLSRRVREADLVLAIGTRLGETTTSGYRLLAQPRPGQFVVQVHPSRAELDRRDPADLSMHAPVADFVAAAAALSGPSTPRWKAWTAAAREDYLETLVPSSMTGSLDLGAVMVWLRARLPADCVVTNGAGNYTSWVHRFHQYRLPHTQLAPVSGAMGYGVPAAIAAKLVHPGRMVVCFAGDGCFQMSAQEMITARQYRLAIVFIVVNNAMYGSIRMHQEMNFPGNVYATDLENPDFPALARAHGLQGHLVTRTEEFADVFELAAASATGALIELRIDPENITPRSTLSSLRERSLRGAA
jgi:acetolactate synthase-1/2/3 large subunit